MKVYSVYEQRLGVDCIREIKHDITLLKTFNRLEPAKEFLDEISLEIKKIERYSVIPLDDWSDDIYGFSVASCNGCYVCYIKEIEVES